MRSTICYIANVKKILFILNCAKYERVTTFEFWCTICQKSYEVRGIPRNPMKSDEVRGIPRSPMKSDEFRRSPMNSGEVRWSLEVWNPGVHLFFEWLPPRLNIYFSSVSSSIYLAFEQIGGSTFPSDRKTSSEKKNSAKKKEKVLK